MIIVDVIVLVVLAYFGFMGFKNGLLREVLGLTGVILALFLAFRYLDPLNQFFVRITGVNDMYSPLITFALIFLAVILATHLVIIALEYVIHFAFLSTPNRVLGLTFGVLKSSLFLSIMFLLLAGFEIPGEQTRKQSILYPYILGVAPVVYNVVGEVYPGTENFQQSVQKTLDEYHIDKFR
jgi:membrane protein required for colicin V production